MTRTCAKCGREKDPSQFHKNRNRKDGLQVYCASCCKKSYSKWRLENPEYMSKYHRANRERANSYERERYANEEGYAQKKHEHKERYNKRNPEKVKARRSLRHQVKIGNIIRPTVCSDCGSTDRKIQAHHDDYSKPLDVVWVCSLCHAKIHYPDRRE